MSSNVPPPPSFEDVHVDSALDVDDIQANAPKVAAAPGKIFVVLVLFLVLIASVAYMIFGEKDKKEKISKKAAVISKETAKGALPPPPPPAPLPTMRAMLPSPELAAVLPQNSKPSPSDLPASSKSASSSKTSDSLPSAPALPATGNASTPPPLPLPATPSVAVSGLGKKGKGDRLKSGMIVYGGKGGGASSEDKGQQKAADALAASDMNLAFARDAVGASKAAKVSAGKIKNLTATIAQGKVIHAILETAINTQLPGQIRAVISHDIYAEMGNARLVPKGSRLIGTYNTVLVNGQNRVFIVWTRIIRPDGIDIMVGSPAVDALGRAGVVGNLDSRYTETFLSSVLTSILGIGVAAGVESTFDTGTSTKTQNTDGSTTEESSPTATAAQQSVQNINNTSKGIIENMLNTRPVITIDQGTYVNVMVNKDLVFPAGYSNNFGSVE